MHKLNIINSQEVRKRIKLLQSGARYHISELDEDDALELTELEDLEKEGIEQCLGGEAAWNDGVDLINDDYFIRYSQQRLEDGGIHLLTAPWWLAIDWEETADKLKTDYSEINMGAASFWVRSA